MSKLFFHLALSFLLATDLLAQSEVVVQDASGKVRAQSIIDEQGQVEIEVLDAAGNPLDGVEVTLTNTVTGEVIKDTAVGGMVVFDGVSSGVWVVSSSQLGVVLSSVTVGSVLATGGTLGLSSAGVGLLAAAGLAGGTVAIAEASDNNSSDNTPLSPFD